MKQEEVELKTVISYENYVKWQQDIERKIKQDIRRRKLIEIELISTKNKKD